VLEQVSIGRHTSACLLTNGAIPVTLAIKWDRAYCIVVISFGTSKGTVALYQFDNHINWNIDRISVQRMSILANAVDNRPNQTVTAEESPQTILQRKRMCNCVSHPYLTLKSSLSLSQTSTIMWTRQLLWYLSKVWTVQMVL
jgi:hypothetical protein